ncbi:MAG: class I SAM-dependent methyltransferase [Firmicutes bacterium]|nr:class I SAM-dependent methyltransferase [Bacillota bacterium]
MGAPTYRALTAIPPLVRQALAVAEKLSFPDSSTMETGRLLHVLASQVRTGRIGEIGTGCGVGAAWIVTAIPHEVSFYTVEVDETRARAVADLFGSYANVRVVHGDWHELLAHGPFHLLFADGGKAKETGAEEIVTALAPGGMLVIDDLTPLDLWPPERRGRPDRTRDFWLNDDRVAATEVLESPGRSVILAVRR